MGRQGIPIKTIEIGEDEPLEWPRFEPDREVRPEREERSSKPEPQREKKAVPA